jgi:predicted nucleic acid-binding protein
LAATAIHHTLTLVARNAKGHGTNRRRTFQSLARLRPSLAGVRK